MEAGRELDHRAIDAEVAEKVFGFTVEQMCDPGGNEGPWYEVGGEGTPSGLATMWCSVSDYSTDWSAMGLVVAEIHKRGWTVDIEMSALSTLVRIKRTNPELGRRGFAFDELQETLASYAGPAKAPQAVSECVLLAVGTPATTTPTEG